LIHRFQQFEGYPGTIHTNTNCLLKCSYCYEFNKAKSITDDKKFWDLTKYKDEKRNYDFVNKQGVDGNVISLDVAKGFIDQLVKFNKTEFFGKYVALKDGFVLDFIGGDSLQYPDLLDDVITYLVEQLITKNHEMLYSWMIGISSNGVTLLSPKARKFCEKWKDNLSVGISIDGCPEFHDLNRWCFADNEDGSHRGSWQYIKEIWPWFKKTFPNDAKRTKWTLALNSYKYLFQSVKFLHEELGMTYIHFNRVMENNILDEPEQLWELIQQFENW
jgi:uncharacterized protein